MRNAQLRKQTKYTELLDSINATNIWKASLWTLEIGARGLVGLSTHKTFVRLGFTSRQAKELCRKLSSVVARCSYAIYLAHANLAWSHGSDLVVEGELTLLETKGTKESLPAQKVQSLRCTNVKTLRDHSITTLYHFTDASNLESIRKNGLLTCQKLDEMKINAKMNSSDLSRKLDGRKGLNDFVRLSFCKKHPMMYIALKEERISVPVVLEIKLEVVSRPGVLFCEINAAAKTAKASESPNVIRFDVVKAASMQSVVDASLRPFYQGEVLVPDWIPPHLIKIPKVDAFTKILERPRRLPLSSDVTKRSDKVSCEEHFKAPVVALAVEHESLKPKSLETERSSEFGERGSCSNPELDKATPTESKIKLDLPVLNDVGVGFSAISTGPLSRMQNERKAKLTCLIDPDHVMMRDQFAYNSDADVKFMLTVLHPTKPRIEERTYGCQMPLTRSAFCDDCQNLGVFVNCAMHMKVCAGPAWLSCHECARLLCWEHMDTCYCKTAKVGIGGVAARERKREEERKRQRAKEEGARFA